MDNPLAEGHFDVKKGQGREENWLIPIKRRKKPKATKKTLKREAK